MQVKLFVPAETAVLWGQTFETVTRAFLEKDMKVEIYGHKLFITAAKYPRTCNSPDGYFLDGGHAVLLEIKSPWKRIPGDEVPTRYLPPPPRSGMDFAPFCEIVIIESVMQNSTLLMI